MCTIAKVSWYTADPVVSFTVGGALNEILMITLHRDILSLIGCWLVLNFRAQVDS